MTDFNLEAEFGSFLESLRENLDSADTLEQSGVKGMKWGVRKDRKPSAAVGLGPSQVVVTTKRGETLTMTKDPTPAIARFLAKHRPGYLENVNNSASLTITDSKGKKVGEAQLTKVNNDEINLVWLGIKSSERGKGYATAAMEAAVDFGKASGVKKLTLEVPGNSPDAEHIYTKLGFKNLGKIPDDDDSVWGGLYNMELNFADRKIKHAEAEAFIEHFGVKGMKWGVRKRAGNLVTKARGPQLPDSDDAARAKVLKGTAKKSTSALSNKELQDLVTRMNLEQQYSRLSTGDRSPVEKFIADTLVNVGKQQLTRLANDTAATQVGNLLDKKK